MKVKLTLQSGISAILVSLAFSGLAQVRDITTWKGSNLINYSILRYNPVWQVQSGTEGQKVNADRPPFFQDVRPSQMEPLMGLLFSGNDGKRVGGSAREMADMLAKNKIELFAQILKGQHHIFIAHLNGSPNRSIIPFREENGKWLLDLDFSATPMYELLRDPKFDPFSGRYIGIPHLNLGFEGLESGALADHSGNRQRSKVRNIGFAEGRFGKAMRLNSGSQADVEVKRNGDLRSEDISLNLWLKLDAKPSGKVLSAVDAAGVRTIELAKTAGNKGKVTFTGSKGSVSAEFDLPTDTWFELETRLSRGELVVFVDQIRVSSVKADIGLNSAVHNLTIGGAGATVGSIDELSIGF